MGDVGRRRHCATLLLCLVTSACGVEFINDVMNS